MGSTTEVGIYSDPDLYCAAFPPPSGAELDAVVGCVEGARSILEPFCGHARAAEALVARGLTYVGFDLSPEIVARAPRADGIRVVVADARDFELAARPRGGFDLAWCPVNSLCHITSSHEIVSHLRAMRRQMAPGGAYLVELEIFDREGSTEDAAWTVPLADDSTVEARWACGACDRDARTRVETGSFRRVVAGEVVSEVSESFTMRMWTYGDLFDLTRAGGWTVDPVCMQHADGGVHRSAALGQHVENSGQNWAFVLRPD